MVGAEEMMGWSWLWRNKWSPKAEPDGNHRKMEVKPEGVKPPYLVKGETEDVGDG